MPHFSMGIGVSKSYLGKQSSPISQNYLSDLTCLANASVLALVLCFLGSLQNCCGLLFTKYLPSGQRLLALSSFSTSCFTSVFVIYSSLINNSNSTLYCYLYSIPSNILRYKTVVQTGYRMLYTRYSI